MSSYMPPSDPLALRAAAVERALEELWASTLTARDELDSRRRDEGSITWSFAMGNFTGLVRAVSILTGRTVSELETSLKSATIPPVPTILGG